MIFFRLKQIVHMAMAYLLKNHACVTLSYKQKIFTAAAVTATTAAAITNHKKLM